MNLEDIVRKNSNFPVMNFCHKLNSILLDLRRVHQLTWNWQVQLGWDQIKRNRTYRLKSIKLSWIGDCQECTQKGWCFCDIISVVIEERNEIVRNHRKRLKNKLARLINVTWIRLFYFLNQCVYFSLYLSRVIYTPHLWLMINCGCKRPLDISFIQYWGSVFGRFINQVNAVVFLLFVVLVTMVAMVL